MTANAFFDNHLVGDVANNSEIYIPPRNSRSHYIFMNLTFTGDEGYIAYVRSHYIYLYCNLLALYDCNTYSYICI